MGIKRCAHDKLKGDCAECDPCPHGKVKRSCVDCSGCPHGKVKRFCVDCQAARTVFRLRDERDSDCDQ